VTALFTIAAGDGKFSNPEKVTHGFVRKKEKALEDQAGSN
jgi:hypothetical protein